MTVALTACAAGFKPENKVINAAQPELDRTGEIGKSVRTFKDYVAAICGANHPDLKFNFVDDPANTQNSPFVLSGKSVLIDSDSLAKTLEEFSPGKYLEGQTPNGFTEFNVLLEDAAKKLCLEADANSIHAPIDIELSKASN